MVVDKVVDRALAVLQIIAIAALIIVISTSDWYPVPANGIHVPAPAPDRQTEPLIP